MNLSAFKPFFSFIEPSWSPKLTYGLTHFYNRARSNIDWNSFSVIKPASEHCGEVLIGQIPVKSFHSALNYLAMALLFLVMIILSYPELVPFVILFPHIAGLIILLIINIYHLLIMQVTQILL
jgi:hypothetical protein